MADKEELKDYNIYFDKKEKSKELILKMKSQFKAAKLPYINRNLISGDLVFGSIGIERKTIDDFISSMDYRIWEEIHKMKQSFTFSYVIIIGDPKRIKPSIRPAFYGAVANIAVEGVNSFWVLDESAYVGAVISLYKKFLQYDNPEYFHMPKINLTKYDAPLSGLGMLMAVESISKKKALSLVDHFGSVKKVLIAKEEELKQVKLIGGKTAKKIKSSYRATKEQIHKALETLKEKNDKKRKAFVQRKFNWRFKNKTSEE